MRLQQVYNVFGFPMPAWLVFLAVCEVVGVVLVIRLWMKRKDLSVFGKVVRSIILLIPFFGLIFYIPLALFPDRHGDDPPESPTGFIGAA
ncbi:MAG: hypothetical protein WA117_25440 [Verrucomicrobiia bacterium]